MFGNFPSFAWNAIFSSIRKPRLPVFPHGHCGVCYIRRVAASNGVELFNYISVTAAISILFFLASKIGCLFSI